MGLQCHQGHRIVPLIQRSLPILTQFITGLSLRVSDRCDVERHSLAAATESNTSPGILTPLVRNTDHCSGHWEVNRG